MKGSMRMVVPFGVVMRTVACPSQVMDVPFRSAIGRFPPRNMVALSLVRCVNSELRAQRSARRAPSTGRRAQSTGCRVGLVGYGWLEGGDQMAGPGVDGVPVASVAGRQVAHRGDEGEGEAELLGVEFAAKDLLSDGGKPGKFDEFLLELIAGSDEFFLVSMHGTEDEEGDGELGEYFVVGDEEAAGVFVHA